jgi:hypothetical protein
MKGLVKDISSVAIAGLILASGAIAADAQVINNNVKPSQGASNVKNLEVAAKALPVVANADVKNLQVTTKAAPVVAKAVVNDSPNQAKYLKSTPENLTAEPSIFLAQDNSSSLRDQLRIKPLPAAFLPAASGGNTPSLNFGTPSGFGAYWGNAFISASGATAGSKRDGNIDGSISVGFGLGTPDTIGAELSYNQGSIKNFGKTGTFDAKIHRIVYSEGTNQVSVAVGWNAFAQHVGSEPVTPSSVYGVISTYSLLQASDKYNTMPISFSVGLGGGTFRKNPASTGVFAGVGVQVLPQFSVGAAWSGVGVNAGVSYVPYPEIPLTFVLTGGDLTDSSVGGTVLVLSASYGFNFAK